MGYVLMIRIIELDKIAESPRTILAKRTKMTEQTSIDHNETDDCRILTGFISELEKSNYLKQKNVI